MSFELAPGTLLNNRYQIKKVVSFSNAGGVYLARDLKVTDRTWVVKELIPSPELDETTLANRRGRFLEAVESAMQFEHANLPRILETFNEARREYVVMEHVDGVSLQVLSDMSVNPLGESQVLPWGLQICDALAYLHNRPRPFIFDALDPSHVILTPDERIKLVNFGLDRFFRAEDPGNVFADDPADVRREFRRFADTLCVLLTKQHPSQDVLPAATALSPATAALLNQLLQGTADKTHSSFDEIRVALDQALHPLPEAPKTTESKRSAATVIMPVAREAPAMGETVKAWALRFASQPLKYVVGEVVTLVVVLIAAYWVTHPGITYKKSGAVAYLAQGNHQLIATRVADRKIADSQTLTANIGDLATHMGWLYVSDAGSNRILRFATETDLPPEKFPVISVDMSPTRMIVDERHGLLYTLHESTRNVSRVNVNLDPPQMQGIVSVGNQPHDLAVSSNGELLFVSNGKDQTVSFVDPDTSKTSAVVTVPGTPWGLAVAPTRDGADQLWVCLQQPDALAVIDTDTHEVKQTITDLGGGSQPVAAVLSADGGKLYVAMAASRGVFVFDTAKGALIKQISTGSLPSRLLTTAARDELWVICTGTPGGVTIIDTASSSVRDQIPLSGLSGAAVIAR